MDITEVTNEQFLKFVEETGSMTFEEREIDWEEMKNNYQKGLLNIVIQFCDEDL